MPVVTLLRDDKHLAVILGQAQSTVSEDKGLRWIPAASVDLNRSLNRLVLATDQAMVVEKSITLKTPQ